VKISVSVIYIYDIRDTLPSHDGRWMVCGMMKDEAWVPAPQLNHGGLAQLLLLVPTYLPTKNRPAGC